MNNILLITPPFTQLNTPYPATAYLKGFLNKQGENSVQADLGIEVILRIFSRAGLTRIFDIAERSQTSDSNLQRMICLRSEYINTIDSVIRFLQGKDPTLALQICQEDYLPEARRFQQLDELDWAFGTMGTQDKAKHLATLYLEDLSDLIVGCIDPHFGFSRYAERLGRSAASFDELYLALKMQPSFIDEVLFEVLAERMSAGDFFLLVVSVPFPGNLYAAFRSAWWVKRKFPNVKLAMGGGFPNTELRSLSDERVFEFFDFICLDDGERPLLNLIQYLRGLRTISELKRTFILENGLVRYVNGSAEADFRQAELGTPDYSDLPLSEYISVIEVVNPMHRMWSDGRWNKLTMAHGCYWGKCTFCDISLDYIKIYEPVAAKLLADRMEELVANTGQTGFHFVDEAAPPALMRALALEILRRELKVTWWTNIRFEKSFTADLCRLLRASGCIAVSGGLEVASDRLLKLIDKGVTVEQVARVNRNFTGAGIMVHSYLMYGYPTQTVQETIDSLEMVRQMFSHGILQSGFWHQFAMTAHSPVGLAPEKYGVSKVTEAVGSFANNDIEFIDNSGVNHDDFSFGLKKSLYNFMHGIGFEYPLQDWFDFKIPKTSVKRDFIQNVLEAEESFGLRPTAKVLWLGTMPQRVDFAERKKGMERFRSKLNFNTRKESFSVTVDAKTADWLMLMLSECSSTALQLPTLAQMKVQFEQTSEDFESFWFSKPMQTLRVNGLLLL